MKFLSNVEIDGSLTVSGTNVKNQLSTLQTSINTANTNMNKIKTYVGSDGKLHFTNASGADTALNFSSGKFASGTVTFSTSPTTITLGFKPKYICVYMSKTANTYNYGISCYNSDIDPTKVYHYNGSTSVKNLPNTGGAHSINEITDDGFIFGKVTTGANYGYYFAIG